MNNVQAGSTVVVAGPSSSSVTLGIGQTGLTSGTFTANEISTGGGSLSSVVSEVMLVVPVKVVVPAALPPLSALEMSTV